tara:strand:- start:1093 stop:1746 length:654 start_codon:yes stop_codon:yes gene_type:complete
MQKTFLLISIIVLTAILSISLLLDPSRLTSNDFWIKIGWLGFLVFLNTYFSISFFSKSSSESKHSSKEIAVLPSAGLLIFLYSIISASFLFLGIYFDFVFIDTYQAILQIVLASSFLIIIMLIFLTSKGAEVELPNTKRREDLLSDIQSIGVDNDLLHNQSLIDLKDYIKFKMPHPSSINADSYNEIVRDIEEIKASDFNDQIDKKVDKILLKLQKI